MSLSQTTTQLAVDIEKLDQSISTSNPTKEILEQDHGMHSAYVQVAGYATSVLVNIQTSSTKIT